MFASLLASLTLVMCSAAGWFYGRMARAIVLEKLNHMPQGKEVFQKKEHLILKRANKYQERGILFGLISGVVLGLLVFVLGNL